MKTTYSVIDENMKIYRMSEIYALKLRKLKTLCIYILQT
jgi:hypothetical protein